MKDHNFYKLKMSKFFELLESIARSSINKVKEILSDEDTNIKETLAEEDATKYTPLFHACFHQNEEFGYEVVKMMLEKGADPFHLDKNGQDVIYYLAKDGNIFFIQEKTK